jgi:hypothetical protein
MSNPTAKAPENGIPSGNRHGPPRLRSTSAVEFRFLPCRLFNCFNAIPVRHVLIAETTTLNFKFAVASKDRSALGNFRALGQSLIG